MKQFTSRIAICVTPVVLSIAIVLIALWNYTQPPLQLFGYRILSGMNFKLGCDLVGGTILVYEIDPAKKPQDFDKDKLVAALKKRLDPADLYNITIRPVSDTRVEVILPTGGRHRVQAEEKIWEEFLDKVRQEYKLGDTKLDIRRGNTAEVVSEVFKATRPSEESIKEFITKNYTADADAAKNKTNWDNLLKKVKDQWSLDKLTEADAPVGDTTVLTARVRDRAKPTVAEIEKFLEENYNAGQKRELTGDEVERIKELISRVGSLEFLIVANSQDDRAAIDAAEKWLTDPKNQEELKQRNIEGAAPPMPPGPEDGAYKATMHGETYYYTYRWVELGKNYLHSMHLNNAASTEKSGNAASTWQAFNLARENPKERGVIRYNSELFYSRPILNPSRLSEKDKDKKYEYFMLVRNPHKGEEVTGEYLINAREDQDKQGKLAVGFRFNSEGANRFYELTYRNRPDGKERGAFTRALAIVLDDQIMSAPHLQDVIRDSGVINGGDAGFSRKEVDLLITVLRSGALPATLIPQPVSENTMGATLGDDTIRWGTISVFVSFLAVLAFMVFYYRFAGLVACVALLANLLLTVAFMVAVSATFTLPGLAGLVLMLAMAVDANVLIYERIREERERNNSLALSIRHGYDRALPTVIDTHLSSIFTAIVLYVVGNDQLKGFGISLTVGLLISLFTSLYMTRVLFDIWMYKGWLTKLSMVRFLATPNWPFMSIRKQCFAATVIFTIFGLLLFLYRGRDGLNMDFVGGTVYTGELKDYESVADLRKELEERSRQEEFLKLKELPKEEPPGSSRWLLTYAKDGQERRVVVQGDPAAKDEAQRKVTPEYVKEHAEKFPVAAVELLFVSGANENGKSRFFTIRTEEKSRDLVQAAIARLLGDKLKNNQMEGYYADQVTLLTPGKTPFADSKTTIEEAFKKANVKVARVEDRGTEREGKLQACEVYLGERTRVSALEPILAALKKEKKVDRVAFREVTIDLSDFAYLAQVKSLLEAELRSRKALSESQTLTLSKRKGTDENEDRYKSFLVLFPVPIAEDALISSMKGFGEELSQRPIPVRLENFDSQLAAETQGRALYAILASWGAILLYLWFRFGSWTFGAAAVLCLVHDLCFTLGFIAIAHYLHDTFLGRFLLLGDFKLDLPAIASLLTLIGYSVNDTIVVFDRIREVRGKNPALTPQMIDDSINQTLSRTMLTSFITLLVVLVLYLIGGEGVHLFSFIMVVGVVVGTYSSIWIASPLLLIFGEGSAATVAERERARPAAEAGA